MIIWVRLCVLRSFVNGEITLRAWGGGTTLCLLRQPQNFIGAEMKIDKYANFKNSATNIFSFRFSSPFEPNFSCYLINGSFMKFLFFFFVLACPVEKHFHGKKNNTGGIKSFIKHLKQDRKKYRTRKCCSELLSYSRYRFVHIAVVQMSDDVFFLFYF